MTEEDIKQKEVDEKPKRQKKTDDTQDRIAKLEADNKAIKAMLHSMSSALGLPKSILPDLD